MTATPPPGLGLIRRITDGALLGLLTVAAGLLGCQELLDADVWWHVRAGQWILSQRTVPRTDPFSFASTGRPWIDLHWGFEVLLAAAHRLGGVPGMILFGATLGALSILIAAVASRRNAPTWLIAACWAPALVAMAWRLDPRPEMVSLLLTAAYLAVLSRVERQPTLGWLLVPLQVVWVNMHGLFILGPILVAAFLLDRAILAALGRDPARSLSPETAPRSAWHRYGWVPALLAACLVNPYGLRGALFPLQLMPKITAWGGPYKTYIGEFMDLADFARRQGAIAANNLYFQAEYFLLLAIPPSFVIPAVWSAWYSAAPDRPKLRTPWLAAMALAIGAALAGSVGMHGAHVPDWLARLGRAAPLVFLVLGACAGVGLEGRSSRATILGAIGAIAAAGWAVWLPHTLFGIEPDWTKGLGEARTTILGGGVLASSIAAAVLAAREGARPFRIVAAAMFGYLALQAIRNANLFALFAGFVVTANLADWLERLKPEPSERRDGLATATGWTMRAATALGLGLWIVTIASGRFHRWSGERHPFGLREQPLAYAHEAAKFAGRPGMPERALAFDLRQTGVYVYHNGPERKIYMDSRLEVPSRETFETYIDVESRLNGGRRGWHRPLSRMGDPLILLDHAENTGAEATLLADPRWRCVYYDPAASVFLPTSRAALQTAFPTFDFSAQHFTFGAPTNRLGPDADYELAQALSKLGGELRRHQVPPWSLRIPIALLASDHARKILDASPAPPGAAKAWLLLGYSAWNALPPLSAPPPGPDAPWDPATMLNLAQASYGFRRAAELDGDNVWPLLALHEVLLIRRMHDARLTVADRLARIAPASANRGGPGGRPRGPKFDALPALSDAAGAADAIGELLQQGRPEAAIQVGDEVRLRGLELSWEAADRVAVARLLMGDPAGARKTWEAAPTPPSPVVVLTRSAAAQLVALDFDAADAAYRRALQLEPDRAEAWFGLAYVATQRGRAGDALNAAREGLLRDLTRAQRETLEGIAALAAPFAGADGSASR